ncbi:nitrite reductase large subunit NirB [Paenibacillus sp. PL91]|uniref:nitrite reductase large subunit NirB n=1 Tax=Paenibacillus sp. PL91 TaxID=2729538 RepID=UPI00145EA13A|nr:nitrite reductase large subunit NirB [Paenibacillus sp. PL91]MBC9199104.1 NAD(P)/FAD-dependent oxidoreductase [Paenibacillus sp. PL91]
MSREKLVVIGNGMAGIKCVDEIIKLAPDKFQITVFGNEPHPNYNRILLSKVLQGDSSIESIVINDWSWYEERGIRLYTGETVALIHSDSQYVTTVSGIRADYDHLIIATGSSAFIPPIAGVHKSGVISFRNIDDCRTMMDYAKKYKKAAVIGGGLLGLEAARGLLNLGMETDVIHNAPYLMNRQLDRMSADMLRKELEGQGMRFWLSKETDSIFGLNRAKGIRFTNGTTLEADLIVISVGIRPNVDLAKKSGIETNRAIIVDDYMRTSKPNIYAVGECAEHRGVAYGLVAPLYEQGKVLAKSICGQKSEPYLGSVPYAQLKVSGVEVFSVGEIRQEEAETAVQEYDGIRGTYKKVTMKEGTVRGVILFGDTAEGTSLLELVKRGAAVSELNRPSSTGGSSGLDHLAEMMPERETVCACNAVQKCTIMSAVTQEGLQTTDQVRDHTKASSSCGGCRPMVAAIVQYALSLGKESVKAAIPPICGCTDVSHELLKEAIKADSQSTIQEIKTALGWKKQSGCSVCNSALSYYSALYHPQASYQGSNNDAYSGFSLVTVPVSPVIINGSLEPFDALSLGSELQSCCESLPFPVPVKAAITASMHHPAGVLVHDIGITGAPAGWEIYAGGHAEHPVKQGQLIAIAETEALALTVSLSCLQLYRENAEYDEPLWKWLERAGIIEIREMLLDSSCQMELTGRAQAAALVKQSVEGLGESICLK